MGHVGVANMAWEGLAMELVGGTNVAWEEQWGL